MKSVSCCFIILFAITCLPVQSQDKIDVFILNKNYDAALAEIEKLSVVNPGADLFFKKGIIFQSLQDYQQALQAFSQGLLYNPASFELNSETAECLTALGNYRDAVPFYQKALQIRPENLSVKAKLGRTLINQNDYKQAYQIFSEIYKTDSMNVFWNKQLAFCAFRTDKKQEAIVLYEKVLDQNPHDHSSYINLSHLYDRRKTPEKVVDLLTRGLNQFPGDEELHLEFARLYFGSGQYDLAVPHYESYFSAGGLRELKIQLNYAISCYFARDEKKSLEALKLCSTFAPNDPFVLFYKSLNHKRLAEYDDAQKYMEGAIEMSYPDFLPEMYHHLGQIHGQQREFEESISALKKSYELDPTDYEVLFEIATTYEEYNSNKTLALNYYRLYLEEAGESAKNVNYALDRITKIKEELFFEE